MFIEKLLEHFYLLLSEGFPLIFLSIFSTLKPLINLIKAYNAFKKFCCRGFLMPLKMFQQVPDTSSAIVKNTVAIAAGKGGVGKSTVTVNLALALRLKGYAVGVLDADIYGPSVRKMLPEEEMPQQKGEALYPAICQGIAMMSMAYFRKEHEAAAVRGPIAAGIISQFIKNVQWGGLDFLLIDFPPGTGDIQLTLSQQANLSGAILVTTPQEVSLNDVRKASHLFLQVNVPIFGVIENMSYYSHPSSNEVVYLFGKGGGERLAQELGTPFLGGIPVDPEISRCGDAGRSLFHDPASKGVGAEAFLALTDNFLGHVDAMHSSCKDCLTSFELIWKEMP